MLHIALCINIAYIIILHFNECCVHARLSAMFEKTNCIIYLTVEFIFKQISCVNRCDDGNIKIIYFVIGSLSEKYFLSI